MANINHPHIIKILEGNFKKKSTTTTTKFLIIYLNQIEYLELTLWLCF